MKTMKKYLSMAALALVGAIMTGCSSSDDDSIIDNPQQPESKSKVVTLTTKVGFDGGATTRALTSDGAKTFAAGEKIAVIYTTNGGATAKAVSEALQNNGDITDDGKSATFTVTLDDPNKSANVTYIYPAAMANSDGTINYAALNSQDGTLATLSSNLDLATYTGAWDAGALPTGTLTNPLAILAMTLKNDAGGSNITSSITGMTIKEGSNTYAISGISSASTIYVAINPTSSANLEITATGGTKTYAKALSGKTYAANHGYNVTWRMAEVISGKFSVSSTKQVYFSKSNLNATTSDNGTHWSWHFVDTQYARVGGSPDGKGTLTGNNYINGNGTVNSSGNGKNIDLFGWSTANTYLGINNSTDNNTYSGVFVDWGSHADVIAGIGTGWRTLTSSEWSYLLVSRPGNRFALASIGTRGGIILLPDDWKTSYYTLNNINDASKSFDTNIITATNWTNKLEAHGAVFLPVTGQRNSGTTVNGADAQLHYWSSTGGMNSATPPAPIGYHLRYMPSGDNKGLAPNTGAGRCNGFSVRLVRDVKAN